MSGFQNLLQEELKDPEFKKEWDDMQPEMDVIRAMIDARIEQNLTQKELAKRTGIDQADISKLENGTRNPSLKLLKRLAHGMGMQLKIEFVPMQTQLRKQRILLLVQEKTKPEIEVDFIKHLSESKDMNKTTEL